jgi:hypothetical protein
MTGATPVEPDESPMFEESDNFNFIEVKKTSEDTGLFFFF